MDLYYVASVDKQLLSLITYCFQFRFWRRIKVDGTTIANYVYAKLFQRTAKASHCTVEIDLTVCTLRMSAKFRTTMAPAITIQK